MLGVARFVGRAQAPAESSQATRGKWYEAMVERSGGA